MFYILHVSSISVVSQFFKHFTKVEKITIRWIALLDVNISQEMTMECKTVNLIYAKKSCNPHQPSNNIIFWTDDGKFAL